MSRASSRGAIVASLLPGCCLTANSAIAGDIPTDMAKSSQSRPALGILEGALFVGLYASLEHVLYPRAESSRRFRFWAGIPLSGNGTLASPALPCDSDGRLLAHREDTIVATFSG